MKITGVETLAYAIPKNPYVVGQGSKDPLSQRGRYYDNRHYRAIYSPNAESMVVRIETDAGITGYGEAQSCILPDVVTRVIDQMLAPRMLGADPRHPAPMRDWLYDLMRERGHDSGFIPDAVAACDMALWDIAARAANLPLYQMLGGAYRTSMPCYVSGVPAADLDDELARVEQWVDRGFTRFKFSWPTTIEAHVEHCAKLRERFGRAITILIDAHWAFSVRQTIDLARALEPYAVRWLECPLLPENSANQAAVRMQIRTAHALGEEYRTRYHFADRLARGAIDIAQPDVGRTGITEAMRISALCQSHDVPMAYHVGAGLGVYTAATLHVAAATPGLDLMEFQPSQIAAAEPYFTPSVAPDAGSYGLPPGPGIGVTPDLEALRKFAIK